ncbi:hypothetical protein EXIGLDRAFT_424707 [Exidia glandulosa HHB12029]|uniref:Uncharacterized protein n=1 Tax=Exidia glandulosa HHB12029 TaxID=1314781 RepID=A0A165KKN6_EXIGL|nr:hypothetical protein EXIGLDRAFT_424707 [Exidia glandulosa HHB12029]
MFSQSARVAVFAHALSSWVEGTSQLRAYLLSPPPLSMAASTESTTSDEDDLNRDRNLITRLTRWITAQGAELDDNDSMLMGVVQMTSAVALLKAIRVRPLMPLLLTPVLAAAAVPIPHAALFVSRSLRPASMMVTVLLFAVLHEAERAGVSAASRLTRERQRELAGHVTLHGDYMQLRDAEDLQDDEYEDEEPECIICSAPAASHSQRPRSLSSDSLASLASTTSRATAALGPLEVFCTTAPHKHLAHRACFLAWQTAYAQSHMPTRIVVVSPVKPTSSVLIPDWDDEPIKQARALVGAAPPAIAQLAPLLSRPSPARPLTDMCATLELHPTMRSAVLTSAYPPCPLCRSKTSITLSAVSPPKHTIQSMSLTRIVRTFVCEWSRLVSPRTIGARLLGQGAFLWALLGVMRVREEVCERVRQRATGASV